MACYYFQSCQNSQKLLFPGKAAGFKFRPVNGSDSGKKWPLESVSARYLYFFVFMSKCIFLHPVQTKFYYHVRHCNKSKENYC